MTVLREGRCRASRDAARYSQKSVPEYLTIEGHDSERAI